MQDLVQTLPRTVVFFTSTSTVRQLEEKLQKLLEIEKEGSRKGSRSVKGCTDRLASREPQGSAESESGSKGDTSTSPPVATIEAETGVREEATNREDEEEITNDDTMVMYVNAQELNPALRPQLIACYRFKWTVNRSKEFFDNGIVNKTEGFKNLAIMPETRVVVADIKAFSDIYRIFQLHHFDWMDNAPGKYSSHLTREFYSSYAATLMNFAAVIETTKHGQKDMAITWGPLNSIIVRGKSIDISKASINKMLYGSEHSAPTLVDLFEGKHHEVTSDATMVDQTSRERVLCWIAKQIAIDGENVVWVITTPTLITKASLSFPTKVWNVANHLFGAKSAAVNTLVVVPHVPFDIPHTDRGPEHEESSQPSTEAPAPPASASQTPGTFVTIPMLFLEKLVADQCQTKTLVDQIVLRMPQLIETKVLAAKKEIKDGMRTELSVLRVKMDGLENLVQDRFQAASSADTEEFRAQLAEMRTQIAKLAEKPVQVPTTVIPESLMQMLSQVPSTQSLDDLWGEPPMSKSGKRKHKAGDLDEETPTDLAREARRQEKRAHTTSKRESWGKKALEQQQRDAALVGASGSGAPAPTNGDQTDYVPSSKSGPIDKCANVDPMTGA
uniref:Putative plant transposon protein domain-containing protein n=1 Tax=Solanum tuberosum TaxID=4113 RepID=M1DLY3_SOLTU